MGRVLGLNECLAFVRSFCLDPFLFTSAPNALALLETDRNQSLPAHFRHYLQHAVQHSDLTFCTIGHPIHPAYSALNTPASIEKRDCRYLATPDPKQFSKSVARMTAIDVRC